MRQRKAFTLVELLVVIGIIALLISILLPALNKARSQAKVAACLSNMRQLGTVMRIYATQYNDICPIGYIQQSQFSYVVNWRGPSGTKPILMGNLALARLMKAPQTFYCPAYDQNPQFTYNSSVNVWPDFANYPNDPKFQTPLPTSSDHTRISYNTRPLAYYQGSTGSNPIPYMSATYTEAEANSGAGQYPAKRQYPKFSKLKNSAIVSDLVISHYYVDPTHKTGVNILYANGGAKFVPTKTFMNAATDAVTKGWQNIPDPTSASEISVSWNDIFLTDPVVTSVRGTTTSTAAHGLWIEFDKAGQ